MGTPLPQRPRRERGGENAYCCLWAGGVGGYFGGRLAQAGAEVHFIARGAHLRALREHGLTVRSVRGDFQVQAPATDDPGDVGPCDFVLFCVKTFDTDAAAARLGPLVGDGTAVVSLQNGVENHLRPLGQAPRKRRQKRPTSPTPSQNRVMVGCPGAGSPGSSLVGTHDASRTGDLLCSSRCPGPG